jgi:hypothetical protein
VDDFHRLFVQLRGQGPAVVELGAAKPAMVEPASGKAFEQVEETVLRAVNPVAFSEPGQFVSSASGTARSRSHVHRPGPRRRLQGPAVLALEDRNVAETLAERAMNTV